MTDHTIAAFDDDLLALRSKLSELGSLVMGEIERLETTLNGTSLEDAEAILKIHSHLLRSKEETEQMAMRTLARWQPVANDLRSIIVALRVARDLGNMSYNAAKIASQALTISGLKSIPMPDSLGQLTESVATQARRVLTAYKMGDVQCAREIWFQDQDLDRMHNVAFADIAEEMAKDPRALRQCICYIMSAKHMERIGDCCTGIAESICYEVTAERIAAPRPKDDQTSMIAPQV